MRNMDYDLNALCGIICTEQSYSALMGIISDLGLEVTDVRKP